MIFGYDRDMDFKKRLRECMTREKLTAKALADKAGISVYTLNTYLGSRSVIPSADVAVKLARQLKVSVEYLMTDVIEVSGYEEFPDWPIEDKPQSELYLKGKGKTIEVRTDSRVSMAYLKAHKGEVPAIAPENPQIGEIAALIGRLSDEQLDNFSTIARAYVDGVFSGKE